MKKHFTIGVKDDRLIWGLRLRVEKCQCDRGRSSGGRLSKEIDTEIGRSTVADERVLLSWTIKEEEVGRRSKHLPRGRGREKYF